MFRNGWLLFLLLLCVAFLVSCGKNETMHSENEELIKTETGWEYPVSFLGMLEGTD